MELPKPGADFLPCTIVTKSKFTLGAGGGTWSLTLAQMECISGTSWIHGHFGWHIARSEFCLKCKVNPLNFHSFKDVTEQ